MGGAVIKNHLQKTGGVMSGDLDLGLNSLKLTDGSSGGILKAGAADTINFRNKGDTGYGELNGQAVSLAGNVAVAGTVDGVDVALINQAKILTGTYSGDGNNDRSINIGHDLTAKYHQYVIVKSLTVGTAMHRTEHGQGDLAMHYDGQADETDTIQSFNATGFVVGQQGEVNTNGVTYTYIGIYEEP